MKRLLAKIRSTRGYTLIELLIALTILTIVVGSIVSIFVASSNAQITSNRRFQAQQSARMALERMRREVHCATAVTPAGRQARASLSMPAGCPGAPTATTITYCARSIAAGRYGIYRLTGAFASCTGGALVADYVTRSDPFNFTAGASGRLSTLEINLPVDLTPADTSEAWSLTDTLVLRNATR